MGIPNVSPPMSQVFGVLGWHLHCEASELRRRNQRFLHRLRVGSHRRHGRHWGNAWVEANLMGAIHGILSTWDKYWGS